MPELIPTTDIKSVEFRLCLGLLIRQLELRTVSKFPGATQWLTKGLLVGPPIGYSKSQAFSKLPYYPVKSYVEHVSGDISALKTSSGKQMLSCFIHDGARTTQSVCKAEGEHISTWSRNFEENNQTFDSQFINCCNTHNSSSVLKLPEVWRSNN